MHLSVHWKAQFILIKLSLQFIKSLALFLIHYNTLFLVENVSSNICIVSLFFKDKQRVNSVKWRAVIILHSIFIRRLWNPPPFLRTVRTSAWVLMTFYWQTCSCRMTFVYVCEVWPVVLPSRINGSGTWLASGFVSTQIGFLYTW
jgi:hypothetical protein